MGHQPPRCPHTHVLIRVSRDVGVDIDILEIAAPRVVGERHRQEPLQGERPSALVRLDGPGAEPLELVEEHQGPHHVRRVFFADDVRLRVDAEGPRRLRLVAHANVRRKRVRARDRGVEKRAVPRRLEHLHVRVTELAHLVGFDDADAVPASAGIAPAVVGALVIQVTGPRAGKRDTRPVPVGRCRSVPDLIGQRRSGHVDRRRVAGEPVPKNRGVRQHGVKARGVVRPGDALEARRIEAREREPRLEPVVLNGELRLERAPSETGHVGVRGILVRPRDELVAPIEPDRVTEEQVRRRVSRAGIEKRGSSQGDEGQGRATSQADGGHRFESLARISRGLRAVVRGRRRRGRFGITEVGLGGTTGRE